MKRRKPTRIKCKPGYYLPKGGAVCRKISNRARPLARKSSTGDKVLSALNWTAAIASAGGALYGLHRIAKEHQAQQQAEQSKKQRQKIETARQKEAEKIKNMSVEERTKAIAKEMTDINMPPGKANAIAKVVIKTWQKMENSTGEEKKKHEKRLSKMLEGMNEQIMEQNEINRLVEKTGISPRRAEAYRKLGRRESKRMQKAYSFEEAMYLSDRRKKRRSSLDKRAKRRGHSSGRSYFDTIES